jgi:hypothetical protein
VMYSGFAGKVNLTVLLSSTAPGGGAPSPTAKPPDRRAEIY